MDDFKKDSDYIDPKAYDEFDKLNLSPQDALNLYARCAGYTTNIATESCKGCILAKEKFEELYGSCSLLAEYGLLTATKKLIDENKHLLHICSHSNEPNLDYIKGLKSSLQSVILENKMLKDKINNSEGLLCSRGDTVYLPWNFNGKSGIEELHICAIHLLYDNTTIYSTDLEEVADDTNFLKKYYYGNFSTDDFNKIVFISREDATKTLNKENV